METEMDEETKKRTQFIYELIADRFHLEWQRTNDLEGKASSIIGFVGIMVSLQAGLGSFLLKGISRTSECYAMLCLLFLLGIIFLTCSILFSLKAYYVKAFESVPNTEYLIEEYAKKDINRMCILENMSATISDVVTKNKSINDEKVKFIRGGFIFLVLGIGMVIIFVCGLLMVQGS